MANIKIVTDGSCDFPQEIVDKNMYVNQIEWFRRVSKWQI